MPPQKGKAPTKGAKQILTENVSTVHFYRNMSICAASAYWMITGAFFFDNLSFGIILMNVVVTFIYIGCFQLMRYITRPNISKDQMCELIDPGVDLNMEGGMGEHVKDIIILTSITHVLAIVSNFFWLLILLLPIRAFWLLWKNVLGPWFFQPAPEEDIQQDDKKRKKMERKMKRYQQ